MGFWNPNRRRNVCRILTDCCLGNVCAMVMSPESGIVRRGMFRQLDRNSLTVQFADAESSPLIAEALCCVAFQHRNRPAAFYTSILGLQPGPFRKIRLALPESITFAERRHAVRVPVIAEAAVEAIATLQDGNSIKVVPVDLSLAGLLAEVSATEITRLSVGVHVRIDLACPRGCAEIPAKVSRHTDAHCGFAFERAGHQQAAWREDLGKIVKHTEDRLIERRYGSNEGQHIAFAELFASGTTTFREGVD